MDGKTISNKLYLTLQEKTCVIRKLKIVSSSDQETSLWINSDFSKADFEEFIVENVTSIYFSRLIMKSTSNRV
jgi:hypothetical protein